MVRKYSKKKVQIPENKLPENIYKYEVVEKTITLPNGKTIVHSVKVFNTIDDKNKLNPVGIKTLFNIIQ